MDLIRKYLVQIKAQLAGLTISQKLLIGLLTVVMLATIFFTVMFSAKPAMVPLIDQPMSSEEINHVERVINKKYDYVVSTDKIMVPAEQAYAIRGELAAAGALPKNMVTAFTNVIKDSTPWGTEKTNERIWNNALQDEMSKWLREFPYLEDGSIIIAHGQSVGLGRPSMPSTATVNVKVRGGSLLSSAQVNAIGEMILGGVPGMNREDVHIIGDGAKAYHMQNNANVMPEDLRELKKAMEDDFTQKLFVMFEHFGDVKIAVNVDPDFSVRTQDVTTYDPKGTVVKTKSEVTRDITSSQGTGAEGGQPGVVPNTGMMADVGGAGHKQSSSQTESTLSNEVGMGRTVQHIELPAGVEVKQMTASLSLPRSYFVKVYQAKVHDAKADPDDKQLDPIIADQLKNVQASAKNVIGAKADDQIRVDWYDDTIVSRPAELALATASFSAGNMGGIITQYAKQGVLAVVALGALGMMLMMVRRAVPAADGADFDAAGMFVGGKKGKKRRAKGGGGEDDVDQLNAGDDVFGEANEGEAVLTGIELDDDTLQSRKMVDEVSTMIKENPENAASLVKRWMAKSK